MFLDAGTPPVYVGFGSMRAPKVIARVAIEAIRTLGRRALVSRGWADLALIDDRDDCFVVGEVNQQRDPRTSDRRGRHDPYRRGDGGCDAAIPWRQPEGRATTSGSQPGCRGPYHADGRRTGGGPRGGPHAPGFRGTRETLATSVALVDSLGEGVAGTVGDAVPITVGVEVSDDSPTVRV